MLGGAATQRCDTWGYRVALVATAPKCARRSG